MSHCLKNWIWAFGSIFIGFFLFLFCNSQTKGFRAANITPAVLFDERWEVANNLTSDEQAELFKTLHTPFYFLGKGGTADVFRSQDDRFVIKFLKKSRFTPPSWATWQLSQLFIPSICNDIVSSRKKHYELQYSSYKMSIERLQHQTGVVYLHLNPTSDLKTPIVFYDNIGVKHQADADTTAFVIQKKAQPFPLYFKQLLANGDKEKAKKILAEFASFLNERAEKGIKDADIGPRFNLGIFKDTVMTFDIDQLRTSSHLNLSREEHMLQDAKEMFYWLQSKDADLVCFLKEEIARLATSS